MVVSLVRSCDVCTENTPAEAVIVDLTGGRRKPQVLDLCDTHKRQFIEPLEALLAEHGQVVKDYPTGWKPAARANAGSAGNNGNNNGNSPGKMGGLSGLSDLTCPLPRCPGNRQSNGDGPAVFSDISSLRSHFATAHKLNPRQQSDALAVFDPEDGVQCPEKGCQRRFGRNTGLAAHVRAIHGKHLSKL